MNTDDVVELIQSRSGCRWIAVEVPAPPTSPLLRALRGHQFELVQSFPVTAAGIITVDLYRFRLPLEEPPPIDLTFQGFSQRVFRGVEPVPSRR